MIDLEASADRLLKEPRERVFAGGFSCSSAGSIARSCLSRSYQSLRCPRPGRDDDPVHVGHRRRILVITRGLLPALGPPVTGLAGCRLARWPARPGSDRRASAAR